MAGESGRRSVGAVHAFVAGYRLDGVTATEHDELCGPMPAPVGA